MLELHSFRSALLTHMKSPLSSFTAKNTAISPPTNVRIRFGSVIANSAHPTCGERSEIIKLVWLFSCLSDVLCVMGALAHR